LAAPVLEGPPARQLTDPHRVISRPMAGVAPIPVSDLYHVRDGVDGVWTRDGRSVVISTNLTGRYNLWKVPVAGGFPLQLTVSEEEQRGLATSPDGKWVAYQSDTAGDEIDDLFAVSLRDGAVTNLTATKDVAEQGARFSRDGRTLAFNHRPRAAPSTNIAVMALGDRAVRVLTHEADPTESWTAVAFVDGDRRLIANRQMHGRETGTVWSLDVATGAATQLSAGGDIQLVATDATADGKLVAVTVERPDGARQAAILEVATGKLRLLMPDAWEQKCGHFSPDGRRLAFSRNIDGRSRLVVFDVSSGKVQDLPLPDGVNEEAASGQGLYVNPDGQTSFSPTGDRFLAAHQSSNTSLDYWVVDLKRRKSRPVTRLGLASVATAPLPKAEIVHYRSQDGTVISALVWLPFNLRRDGSAPAIVMPHGGPAHQKVDDFNREAIAFTSRGFVVIAPNVRGSSGYGRAFENANYKDLGGGDLQDLVAAVPFLVETGYVDPKRIGVTGGSYGGYLTLAAATKAPDLWAAAAEEYGIVDWAQIYRGAGPPLAHYVSTLLGTPDADAAVYAASSPITLIHKLRAPLLVLQGDNDTRVPKVQAETVVDLLTKDGRTVEAHYYANEGHGFLKRENQIDALERVIAWFETHLKHPSGKS